MSPSVLSPLLSARGAIEAAGVFAAICHMSAKGFSQVIGIHHRASNILPVVGIQAHISLFVKQEVPHLYLND